ncbi:hypothetical protein AB0F13_00305 [Streptomyces sp. NPDC026206]|uniref:hypothetical protein n=1 Tax=Streptomyces sp. NPDC026206 TaxID=3157089 RepID=UPI0033E71CA8
MSVAATALAGSLIGATGTASAAGTGTTGTAEFAAQAKKAGLTGSQAKELQSRVDRYLADLGGKQVAVNKIERGDMSVLVTLPGERVARDLTAQKQFAWYCPYENFCMYRGESGTGDQLNLYNCKTYGLTNWKGNGSWYNNQTPGTRAKLMDRNHNVLVTTVGAPSYNPSYNWDPIWYVKPC